MKVRYPCIYFSDVHLAAQRQPCCDIRAWNIMGGLGVAGKNNPGKSCGWKADMAQDREFTSTLTTP